MKRLLLIALAVLALSAVPAASADYMLSWPGTVTDGPVHLGVWFNPYKDSGSRAYTITIKAPNGRVVWQHSGIAPTHWQNWTCYLSRRGKYVITYGGGDAHASVYPVRSFATGKRGPWINCMNGDVG